MSTTTKPTAQQLLTRAVWLAFQASAPMGMGFLNAGHAAELTEKDFAELEGRRRDDGSIEIYLDYVSGRMVKTDFKVSPDGKLTVSPEDPRHDYQSWSGTYRSGFELVAAVEKSFA